jgi:hypothetical protein
LRSKALSLPAKYHARKPRPAKDPAEDEDRNRFIRLSAETIWGDTILWLTGQANRNSQSCIEIKNM